MPQPIKAYIGAVPLFDAGQSSAGYQRPADWLPLPAAQAESVKILNAVSDQYENFTALRMITSTGNYQVDWGDGIVETFSSNTIASHNYDFNNSALDGTLTTRGYKQAIISITPTSGVFTLCNLQTKVSSPAGLQQYNTGFLDININLPSLISGQRLLIGGSLVRHGSLERVYITSWGANTSLADLFFGCSRLQSVNETEWNMANINNVGNIFRSCSAIFKLNCLNWNINGITTWANAFLGCNGLVSFKASSGKINSTSLVNLFNSCYALEELDLSGWDVSSVTSMLGMFGSCFSLRDLNITGWDTSAVNSPVAMFTSCTSLQKIPAINLSAVTSFGGGGGQFCNASTSLTRVSATGINATITFASCMLGADALNEIYTNLSANGAGKTITVTGNYGTASDNPSIATAKGWTVIG
jgi:surface protein